MKPNYEDEGLDQLELWPEHKEAFPWFRVIAAIATVILIMVANNAWSHDAIPTAASPQGWKYPFACCSGYDCREVNNQSSPVRVTEKDGGYVVSSTGEFLAPNDKRLRDSPDGEFHWCSVSGTDDGKTICLFRPLPSY